MDTPWRKKLLLLLGGKTLPPWLLVSVGFVDWLQRREFVERAMQGAVISSIVNFLREWGWLLGILWLGFLVTRPEAKPRAQPKPQLKPALEDQPEKARRVTPPQYDIVLEPFALEIAAGQVRLTPGGWKVEVVELTKREEPESPEAERLAKVRVTGPFGFENIFGGSKVERLSLDIFLIPALSGGFREPSSIFYISLAADRLEVFILRVDHIDPYSGKVTISGVVSGSLLRPLLPAPAPTTVS